MPETSIPISVQNRDGSAGTPTARHQVLLEAAQRLLATDEHFQQLQHPTLSRVEVNEGLNETDQGYLYLRYDVPGTVPQEFWAHFGSRNQVAWKSGQVSVRQR